MDKTIQDALEYFKKYDPNHYRYLLSNNYERAVFLKGDPVYPREATRYLWANRNLLGKNILEIGCSTGYGSQFLPNDIKYLGLDYDPVIIQVAQEQKWNENIPLTINLYDITDRDGLTTMYAVAFNQFDQYCSKPGDQYYLFDVEGVEDEDLDNIPY